MIHEQKPSCCRAQRAREEEGGRREEREVGGLRERRRRKGWRRGEVPHVPRP